MSGATVPRSSPGRAPRLAPGWPLVIIFAGIPLWWVLGVFQIMFFVMSVPMLVYLVRRREVVVPRGTGVWLLFLVWVLGGVMVLQVDAPGAVPGDSMFRYLTFAYRFGWYLVGTVALLYVVNSRHFLTTERIAGALSWMFIALLGGGLLGLSVPTLEFPSLLELLLPGSISGHGFVSSLIHPQAAQVHSFLGSEEARPSAPFAYTNEWGLAIAVSLPFFIVAWWRAGGVRRWLLPLCVTAALLPIVSSMNRGLWLALVVMALYATFSMGLRGHLNLMAGMVGGLLVAGVLVATSPLATIIVDRLNTPHSNEGRTNLGSLSVESTVQGSPLLGFGTTRDVQGNFTSIAGGATDQCSACAPPALGTQGQLWLLIFGAGLIGAALFIGFVAGQLLRNIRNVSIYSTAAACAVVGCLVTLPVYTTVGPSLYVVLIAVGILHREGTRAGERTLGSLVSPALRQKRLVVAAGIFGAVVGVAGQVAAGVPSSVTYSVLAPRNLTVGPAEARPLSIDSEGALAESGTVVAAIRDATGASDINQIPASLRITADPNSRILPLTYEHHDPDAALAGARAAADAFLGVRADLALGTSRFQESGAQAQALRIVGPVRSVDPWVVAVSSGLAMGVVGGLLLAQVLDGRIERLRKRPESRLEDALPTLIRISGEEAAAPTEHERVRRMAEVYSPLAGVLAVETQPSAVRLADALEQQLSVPGARAGRRVLLVASTQSRPRPVNALQRMCRSNGMDPVGLILIDEKPSKPVTSSST